MAYWLPSTAGTQDEYLLRMGSEGLLPRTLVVELGGVVIGELYLHVTAGWAQVEVADQANDSEADIGWALDPAYRGHGYATEDLGVRRVVATAFADNGPSIRVMERLGMRCETRGVRTTLHRDRGWVDSVGYALLVDEWRDVAAAEGALR